MNLGFAAYIVRTGRRVAGEPHFVGVR